MSARDKINNINSEHCRNALDSKETIDTLDSKDAYHAVTFHYETDAMYSIIALHHMDRVNFNK